jgi:hypothetical protein
MKNYALFNVHVSPNDDKQIEMKIYRRQKWMESKVWVQMQLRKACMFKAAEKKETTTIR